VRAEEVAGAGGSGGEGGGEEAAGPRAAAAAGAQADHRLIRLHASGERIRPGSESRGAGLDRGIGERAWGNRGGIECGGERLGGFRLRPLSFGEERRRKGGVDDGRGWGFIWGARAVGLYRSFMRDGEGNFVIACKVFAGRVALGPACRVALVLAVVGNDGSRQVTLGYLQLRARFQLPSDAVSSPTVDGSRVR